MLKMIIYLFLDLVPPFCNGEKFFNNLKLYIMNSGNVQGVLFTAVGVAVGVVLATMIQKQLMKPKTATGE